MSKLLTVKQVRPRLGKKSNGAVYDLVRKGIIPPGVVVRLGWNIRFNEDAAVIQDVKSKKAGRDEFTIADPARLTLSGSSTIVAQQKRNYRAEVTGVECRAFRRVGRGQCPESPHGFLWRVSPETPHSRRAIIVIRRRQLYSPPVIASNSTLNRRVQ